MVCRLFVCFGGCFVLSSVVVLLFHCFSCFVCYWVVQCLCVRRAFGVVGGGGVVSGTVRLDFVLFAVVVVVESVSVVVVVLRD